MPDKYPIQSAFGRYKYGYKYESKVPIKSKYERWVNHKKVFPKF